MTFHRPAARPAGAPQRAGDPAIAELSRAGREAGEAGYLPLPPGSKVPFAHRLIVVRASHYSVPIISKMGDFWTGVSLLCPRFLDSAQRLDATRTAAANQVGDDRYQFHVK